MAKTAYHNHKVNLSKVQMRKLIKGGSVKLGSKNLSGDHDLYLTKAQLSKISKAKAKNKGVTVKLSAPQLRHHRKVGAGWFDVVKSVVSNPIVQDLGRFGVNKLIGALGGTLSKHIARAEKKQSGAGVAIMKHMKGKGWFDVVKAIASNPIVQDLGSFAVRKGISALGGAAKGKKGSKRGSKRSKKSKKSKGGSFRLGGSFK